MAKDNSFHNHIMEDVLGQFPGMTSRPMFGGWGIYRNGWFFALIDNNQLYFKVDDSTRADYEAVGSHQFTYTKQGKSMPMAYWLLPESVIEDKELLRQFVDKAVAVAKKGKAAKVVHR